MSTEIVRRTLGTRSISAAAVTPKDVRTLVDDDCWEHLIELSCVLGVEETIDRFVTALDEERERLEKVRKWLGSALSMAAETKQRPPA